MELKQRPVPLRVTPCEVVVYRYDMDALARQRIQVGGQRAYQCFTFARSHLGNLAFVKYDTPYQLDVVMNHVPRYLGSSSYPGVLPDSFVVHNFDMRFRGSELPVEI